MSFLLLGLISLCFISVSRSAHGHHGRIKEVLVLYWYAVADDIMMELRIREVKEGKIRDRIRENMRWLKEVSQLTLAVLSTIPHFRVLSNSTRLPASFLKPPAPFHPRSLRIS